jgi:hypothetical protein
MALGAALWGSGVLAHVLWRYGYYGLPLPNTFYTKVDGLDFAGGAAYLLDFATSYPVLILAWLSALIYLALREKPFAFVHYIAVLTLSYGAYLWGVGGDFMEFRMVDVLLPYAYLAIVLGLLAFTRRWEPAGQWAAVLLVVGLVLIGFRAGLRFPDRDHEVLIRSTMEEHTRRWVVIGKWFRRIAEPGESIAVGAAGAIPYYSGLRTVDMLGLNDRYVSNLPAIENAMVGHRRKAPWRYLEEKKITFVLWYPATYLKSALPMLRPAEFYVEIPDPGTEPARSRSFYLKVRTTQNTAALIRSLRERGVTVVTPNMMRPRSHLPSRIHPS